MLLRDVRERLSVRMPALAQQEGSVDPAWMLLEEAAFMVEILSDQLDRYPLSAIQAFVHMMGGQLIPATPAIGAIIADPSIEGVLSVKRDAPNRFRFFTKQTERSDIVEFTPMDPGATLRKARIVSMAEVAREELSACGKPREDDAVGGYEMWRSKPRPSTIFKGEKVTFVLVATNMEDLKANLAAALERFGQQRRVGWLKLSTTEVSANKLELHVEVDLAGAFARVAPAGLAPGGDLEGDFASLDGTTWTPPVKVADHPMLPRSLRGTAPLRGPGEGVRLFSNIPENFPLAELLLRPATPLPETVIQAVWTTLVNLEAKLKDMRPSIRREFGEGDTGDMPEPTWLAAAMDAGVWARMKRSDGATTIVHVDLAASRRDIPTLRVSFLAGSDDVGLEAYPLYDNGRVANAPVQAKRAWRIPAPAATQGAPLRTMVTMDVQLKPEHEGLLMVLKGNVEAVFLNTVLVINAPAIIDDRNVTVERSVPEAITLLRPDILGPEVIAKVLDGPIAPETANIIRRFPLARMSVDGEDAVDDWNGVALDPTAGEVIINSPDFRGDRRSFRPQSLLNVEWYRRTDGDLGNVGAGDICLVEQEPGTEPLIFQVRNPVGTVLGTDREGEKEATDRLFAPPGGTAVLPSDYERLVREALGKRGQEWVVRVWTYAERSLLTAAFWPPATVEADAERMALERAVANAGPEQLLVVIGPPEGLVDARDLDSARMAIRQVIRRESRRLPGIRDAIVTRFWGLTQTGGSAPERLPCFDPSAMAGSTLSDDAGHRAPPPRAGLLLNAAVTRFRAEEEG